MRSAQKNTEMTKVKSDDLQRSREESDESDEDEEEETDYGEV